MPSRVVEKYLWLTNNCFEEALRKEFGDDSIFVKTFEVTAATADRSTSYWSDSIKIKINYVNTANVSKCKQITQS